MMYSVCCFHSFAYLPDFFNGDSFIIVDRADLKCGPPLFQSSSMSSHFMRLLGSESLSGDFWWYKAFVSLSRSPNISFQSGSAIWQLKIELCMAACHSIYYSSCDLYVGYWSPSIYNSFCETTMWTGSWWLCTDFLTRALTFLISKWLLILI